MKNEFTPGTKVRFNIPDGGLAKITDYKKTQDWKIPGYLGEGFYLVRLIPTHREIVVNENDLVLAENQ